MTTYGAVERLPAPGTLRARALRVSRTGRGPSYPEREWGGCMTRLRRAGRLLLALLRELGDENAYRRHLERHGRAHSPAEWRRFSDERLGARFTRPKCC